MKWAGNRARMGRRQMQTKFLSEYNGRDVGVNGKTTLENIFKGQGLRMWSGFI
jgi:hypothetical protein